MQNNIFIDNIYTRWYYNIIETASQRDNQNIYTERHHIIPECFYQKRSRKGVSGWLVGNPNVKSNIVKLTAREHFICHWLLTKMISNKLRTHQMVLALSTFQWSSNNQERILTSRQYERARLAVKQARDLQTWYTNEVEERWCIECPPGWRPGRIKGKKWYNNGIKNTRALECPPGYKPGTVEKPLWSVGKKWFNNGIEQCFSHNCPQGWVVGPLPDYFGPRDKILCNNGIEQKFLDQCPEGWTVGRLQSKIVKGKKWFNNGIQQVYSFKCPKGWKRGMLKGRAPSTAGLKWYNNGTTNKLLSECPDGWVSGQLKDKSKAHYSWYTNGIESVKAEYCPEGYKPGRASRSKK